MALTTSIHVFPKSTAPDTEAALLFRLFAGVVEQLPGCLAWHEMGYHLALDLVTLFSLS